MSNAGIKWGTMSIAEKKKYNDLHDKDAARR